MKRYIDRLKRRVRSHIDGIVEPYVQKLRDEITIDYDFLRAEVARTHSRLIAVARYAMNPEAAIRQLQDFSVTFVDGDPVKELERGKPVTFLFYGVRLDLRHDARTRLWSVNNLSTAHHGVCPRDAMLSMLRLAANTHSAWVDYPKAREAAQRWAEVPHEVFR